MNRLLSYIHDLTANAQKKRSSRVQLVLLGCLGLAVLCLALGLLWGVWDAMRGVGSQEWLLLMFLAVFFGVMAVFAPFVPIWLVNVPDNEVWMILDSTDHLERFVGSGLHPVRPVQGFAKYAEKGAIPIVVDLEQVVTSDHFPYHVTINFMVTLNPLNADKAMWKPLRNMTKETIGGGIRSEVTDLVKRTILRVGRQQIDPPDLMNTISDAIRDVVTSRANLGVAFIPGNSVKISLEPPPEVMASRNELWAEESKAEGRVKHLVELLKVSGAHNLSVGDLGRLHFLMNPQVGMRLNLQGGHDLFPNVVPGQARLPAPKPERPAIQMPKIDAPPSADPGQEVAVTMKPLPANPTPTPVAPDPVPAPETPIAEESAMPQKNPPPPPPDHLPEPIPPRPAKRKDPDVIETEQDENGTYIPRNPILRPRKSRPASRPRSEADDSKKG